MWLDRAKNQPMFDSRGLTLFEVLAVVIILGILVAIAVPSVVGLIEKAQEDVCEGNRVELESKYKTHLTISNLEHSDVIFMEYIRQYGEVDCPEHGELVYVDGEIRCSVHSDGSGDEGEDGVPFL
ncbi:type IV pilin protein [Metabacillus litoralis]|uniref:type IV pilin protein n=1 Tax=Metabacillus litoralis TaxID=152268 RepID=UPI00203E1C8E|nr:prepilin-type N-terminal cleavage/methylation domain-containing protein [Metabacillus litoralis]MCM3163759.1 prepilin-type N-terminal cleavage/methylation domain-containing protein [Metabacillus litoralis]